MTTKSTAVTITLEGDAETLASMLTSWRESAADAALRLEKRAEIAQGAPRFRASIERCRDTCEAAASRLSGALLIVDGEIEVTR